MIPVHMNYLIWQILRDLKTMYIVGDEKFYILPWLQVSLNSAASRWCFPQRKETLLMLKAGEENRFSSQKFIIYQG